MNDTAANQNKRLIIVGILIFILAAGFWSGSRYPALDDKASMGGMTQLEDPLSFNALLELQEGDFILKRITYTTINWVNTNKQGMIFGVFLGAAFLTFLSMLRTKGSRNSFMTGAPRQHYSTNEWELLHKIDMRYNRLVMLNASVIHKIIFEPEGHSYSEKIDETRLALNNFFVYSEKNSVPSRLRAGSFTGSKHLEIDTRNID